MWSCAERLHRFTRRTKCVSECEKKDRVAPRVTSLARSLRAPGQNLPMRVSIPNISNATYTPILLPTTQTIQRLVEFIGASMGTAVLTGAGVSVDSGIRAYRGDRGLYINPNYK